MGAGKVLGVFGGIVAIAVAAGVWLVVSDDSAPAAGNGGDKAAAGAPDANGDAAAKPAPGGRKRTKVTGTAALSGVVKRRKGAADAAGQDVVLRREGGDDTTVACDDHGAFKFEQLPDACPFEVRVQAAGFATVRLPGIVLERGEQRDLGTLWLDQAARATVTVRSGLDEPIEGALVEAYAAPADSANYDWWKQMAQITAAPVAVTSAKTGADGKAEFPELASGSWTFAATKSGYGRAGVASRLEGGETQSSLRIILRTGYPLKGRVLNADGQPVAKALVLSGRQQNPWGGGAESALRARTTTDAEGRWSFEALAAGDWALLAGGPGAIPAMAAQVRVPAVKEIDLTLPAGGRLTGTVTHADTSKPVEGVVVRAMCYGVGARFAEATTDAEGRYAIDPVPDQSVNDVQVTKEGFVLERGNAPQGQVTWVPRGETVTKDMKVREGGTLTGLVTGPDGPVAGARIQVWVGLPTGGWTGISRNATSDAEGRFSIVGLDKGRGVAQATKEGMYQKDFPAQGPWQALQDQGDLPYRAQTGPGVEAKVEVRMERGVAVSGRVEGPEGPVADAKVSGGGVTTVRTDAEGKFRIEGVKPGQPTTIWAQKDGWVMAENKPIQPAADVPLEDVVLRLAKQPVVRGTVASSTGVPLKDARVQVSASGGPRNQMQMYGGPDGYDSGEWSPVRADGTYEVKLTGPAGKFAIRAAALDHAQTDSAPITVTADRTEYEQNVTLEPGSPISGRTVLPGGGAGVAGARVSMRRSQTSREMRMYDDGTRGMTSVVLAVSDAQGLFTIEHVASGTFSLQALAEGFVRSSKDDVKVPDGAPVTVEMQPELTIEGKVTFADGSPVAGASAQAEKADAPAGQPQYWVTGGPSSTITGADGSFRIRGLGAGQYRIRVMAGWNQPINLRQKRSDPVTAGAKDVRIVVEPGLTITGRVLDAQRKPVVGAWISANPDQPAADGMQQMGISTQSKDEGAFELLGLSEGTYSLWVGMQDWGSGTKQRPLQKPKVAAGTKDLELVLEEGLTIEGVVVDGAGKPVASVQVVANPIPDESGQAPQSWGMNATTSADGKFKIGGLAPGKYALVGGGGMGMSMGVVGASKATLLTGGDSVVAGTAGVRLQTTAGLSITGVVVDEAGTPLQGATVHAQAGPNNWRQAQTAVDGAFELTGLPEGKVSLSLWMQGRQQKQVPDVAVGTRDLRIEMPKGVKLTGRLVNASGKAAAGMQLSFQRTDGQGNGWAMTDEDGKFAAEGLAAGTYKVVAMVQKSDGGGWEQKEVGTAKAGDENVELRLP